MTATFLWLLINLADPPHPSTFDQFTTKEECQRVSKVLYDAADKRNGLNPYFICVQAAVAR